LERKVAHSFHLLYYPSVDTLSHARGPYTEEVAAELDSIFGVLQKQLFNKLDRKIAKKTLLLITGDHGAVRIKRESVLDLANHPDLLSCFRLPPTGDSRASIFNLKPGTQDKVTAYFERNFQGQFELTESSRLLSEGYFGTGKVKAETEGRIGDLIALPKFANAIDNSELDSRREVYPGRHGGLSQEEIEVPLIATRLAS